MLRKNCLLAVRSDYDDLQMEQQGIAKEDYEAVLEQLASSFSSL
jgi:hypothetical protein